MLRQRQALDQSQHQNLPNQNPVPALRRDQIVKNQAPNRRRQNLPVHQSQVLKNLDQNQGLRQDRGRGQHQNPLPNQNHPSLDQSRHLHQRRKKK